jgi:hypothetical protein
LQSLQAKISSGGRSLTLAAASVKLATPLGRKLVEMRSVQRRLKLTPDPRSRRRAFGSRLLQQLVISAAG